MVGPGEVDDLLDSKDNQFDFYFIQSLNYLGETKEECQKYGEVDKCLIFEVRRRRNKRMFMMIFILIDTGCT